MATMLFATMFARHCGYSIPVQVPGPHLLEATNPSKQPAGQRPTIYDYLYAMDSPGFDTLKDDCYDRTWLSDSRMSLRIQQAARLDKVLLAVSAGRASEKAIRTVIHRTGLLDLQGPVTKKRQSRRKKDIAYFAVLIFLCGFPFCDKGPSQGALIRSIAMCYFSGHAPWLAIGDELFSVSPIQFKDIMKHPSGVLCERMITRDSLGHRQRFQFRCACAGCSHPPADAPFDPRRKVCKGCPDLLQLIFNVKRDGNHWQYAGVMTESMSQESESLRMERTGWREEDAAINASMESSQKAKDELNMAYLAGAGHRDPAEQQQQQQQQQDEPLSGALLFGKRIGEPGPSSLAAQAGASGVDDIVSFIEEMIVEDCGAHLRPSPESEVRYQQAQDRVEGLRTVKSKKAKVEDAAELGSVQK